MSNALSEEKKKQVIALGQLGWTLRRIQDETGIRRETAAGYLKAVGITVRSPGRWGHYPSATAAKVTTNSEPATAGQRSDDRLCAATRPKGQEVFRYLKGGNRVISLADLKAEGEFVLAKPHRILYADGAWQPSAPPRAKVARRRRREPADDSLF